MNYKKTVIAVALAGGVLALPTLSIVAQQDDPPPMGFFVTSVGIGNGGDLGGLAGADAHCQALAQAAGSNRTWAAYLSTQGANAVNAKDRIGSALPDGNRPVEAWSYWNCQESHMWNRRHGRIASHSRGTRS